MTIIINLENSNNSEFCFNSNNIEWVKKYNILIPETENNKYRLEIKTISEKVTIGYNDEEKRNTKYDEIISNL